MYFLKGQTTIHLHSDILILHYQFPAGLHENTCNVVLKDQYIEWGSDLDVVYPSSCVPRKIFWTLNNRRVGESQSRSVNSTHAVLSLRNFTHQSAILEWHSADTLQVLGGTTITAYCKDCIYA